MNAGSKFEYLWADGVKYKKPTKMCAMGYIDNLMEWVEKQLDDERIFPIEGGSSAYPPNFKKVVLGPIFKRLFRVYGHIYHSHFDHFEELGMAEHLNMSFKHFILCVTTARRVRALSLVTAACCMAACCARCDGGGACHVCPVSGQAPRGSTTRQHASAPAHQRSTTNPFSFVTILAPCPCVLALQVRDGARLRGEEGASAAGGAHFAGSGPSQI